MVSVIFFFKQKTAYEMRISDWSSDVCSSDLFPNPQSRFPNPGLPMSVLRFDNVSKQYQGGHVALSDVSFDVGAGELLFVTDHSAAVKSTLLKLLHLSESTSRGAEMCATRNMLKIRGRRGTHKRGERPEETTQV